MAGFQKILIGDFVPLNFRREARNKLRVLLQQAAVEHYVTEFRNTVLHIPNMADDEKFDRFCEGLKPKIPMEVMKTNVESFDAAVQLALSVDWAYTTFTAGYLSGPSNGVAGFSSPM